MKKAIESMDEKEIDGRIMRVRGSKVIRTFLIIGKIFSSMALKPMNIKYPLD